MPAATPVVKATAPPVTRAAPAPAAAAGPAQGAPRRRATPAPRSPRLAAARAGVGGVAQTGAGFLLALIVWGWLVMPFVEGGPAQVRKVLRAKFLNKAEDGSWLP